MNRGTVLIYVLLTISIILSMALFLTAIFADKVRTSFDYPNSVTALYAADSGVEWCLYVNLSNVSPPVPGLVAHWKLDETSPSTTAADSSGNGNTGTLVNGPTWTTGQINGALDFDGVNDYVDFGTGTSLDMGAGNFSLSGWFKSGFGFGRTMAGKGGTGPGGTRYLITLDETDCGGGMKIKVEIDDDTTKKFTCSSGSSFNDNAWHHAVLVRNGNNLRLYEDGQQVATPTDITGYGNINSTRIFSIGSMFDEGALNQSSFFSGLIDDVRIYDRALSAAEVTDLFNPPPPPTTIPQPVLTNGATYAIYSPATGSTVSDCTESTLNHKIVGSYRDVARSLEISQ